ncbi:MAG: hypothetical protein LBM93_13815 [Oscillospiraceae bacterium]|jgi:hypothetical protein|nr:hypothetical protein [Oscillospiraceae bacterium]
MYGDHEYGVKIADIDDKTELRVYTHLDSALALYDFFSTPSNNSIPKEKAFAHCQSVSFTPGTIFEYCVKKTNFGRASALHRAFGAVANYPERIGFPRCISSFLTPLKKRDYYRFIKTVTAYAKRHKKLEYTVMTELAEVLNRAPNDLLSMAITDNRDFVKHTIPDMLKGLTNFAEKYLKSLNEKYGNGASFATILAQEAQKEHRAPTLDVVISYAKQIIKDTPELNAIYKKEDTAIERKKIVYGYVDSLIEETITTANKMNADNFFVDGLFYVFDALEEQHETLRQEYTKLNR